MDTYQIGLLTAGSKAAGLAATGPQAVSPELATTLMGLPTETMLAVLPGLPRTVSLSVLERACATLREAEAPWRAALWALPPKLAPEPDPAGA